MNRSAPSAKRPPRQPGGSETKGARTRALIKETIIGLIDERGASYQVKLEDVCERTGLTVGAFYFHFPSKEAALEEIVIDFVSGFYGSMANAPKQTTLYGELYTIIAIFVEATVMQRTSFRLPYMVLPTSIRAYQHWLKERDAVIQRMADVIAHHAKRRTASGQDHLAAQFLVAGIEGFMENAFYGSDSLMSKIDLRSDVLIRNLCLLWHRSVAGEEPDARLVQSFRPAAATKIV
jgi:AcrR family transcriptional regulator